ncbi:MAG: toxic anion resistance protein, partial [Eubacterium sp.]
MSDAIKDLSSEAPILTFEPFEDVTDAVPVPEVMAEKPIEAGFDEGTLTAEEREMVNNFAQQIDIGNSGMVMQYGAGAQKKVADFSETALNSVKSQDLGEVGKMLSSMVVELKSFEIEEEEDKGFFGFFKKSANKITSMKAKYATAETNVNTICGVLEKHQIQLLKDVAMLD